MLKQTFSAVYDRFCFQFYRGIFDQVKEREGSLSAMEAISLEVIHMLGQPTIGQFADFLNISQSNATYKVNSLIKKGYIERENSQTDRREYHLILSDKYRTYREISGKYRDTVMERVAARFSAEDAAKFEEILNVMASELMPETDVPANAAAGNH